MLPHWIHSKQYSTQDTQKTTITRKTAFLSQPVLILLHTHPLSHYYNGPLIFICPKWEVGHLITRSGWITICLKFKKLRNKKDHLSTQIQRLFIFKTVLEVLKYIQWCEHKCDAGTSIVAQCWGTCLTCKRPWALIRSITHKVLYIHLMNPVGVRKSTFTNEQ